jgi:acetylornithine deacetylase
VIDAVRRGVDARLDDLYDLTTRLVRERSLLGHEQGAQAIIAERLARLGLDVRRVAIDPDTALADPHGGYPAVSYAGRTNVAARLAGSHAGRSLHLSGHVDVVPVDQPDRWAFDPWAAVVRDGRLYGRGAGDMKAGLAAYLVAVDVFLDLYGPPRGDLVFTSVIEEECGGNGMRSVLEAGYDADATLIGEPTALGLMHGGVGVIWARLSASGAGAHAAVASHVPPPLDALLAAVVALRQLEHDLNTGPHDALYRAASDHPYNLNLGEVYGGVWPSSVPAGVTLRVRLGFGRDLEPHDAQRLVAGRVAQAAPTVRVAFDGFRAHAYHHDPDTPFGGVLAAAHHDLYGAAPARYVSTGTTDARYVTGPCYCYGPLAGNGHAIDEWVDLQSVRDTAVAVAVLLVRWLGG